MNRRERQRRAQEGKAMRTARWRREYDEWTGYPRTERAELFMNVLAVLFFGALFVGIILLAWFLPRKG